MKIIKLLNVLDREEVYLQLKDEHFETFIYHFKHWRDNCVTMSLFDYLENNGIECSFLRSYFIISANCNYNDLNF